MTELTEGHEQYLKDPGYARKVDALVDSIIENGYEDVHRGSDVVFSFIVDRAVTVYVVEGELHIFPPEQEIVDHDGQPFLRVALDEHARQALLERRPEMITTLREVGKDDLYDVPLEEDRLVRADAPQGPTREEVESVLRDVREVWVAFGE
jgi:hypothetical protein